MRRARFGCVLGAICARFRTRCLAVISVNLLAPLAVHCIGGRGSNTRMNCNEEINIDNWHCGAALPFPPPATPPRCLLLLLHLAGSGSCMHEIYAPPPATMTTTTTEQCSANETAV